MSDNNLKLIIELDRYLLFFDSLQVFIVSVMRWLDILAYNLKSTSSGTAVTTGWVPTFKSAILRVLDVVSFVIFVRRGLRGSQIRFVMITTRQGFFPMPLSKEKALNFKKKCITVVKCQCNVSASQDPTPPKRQHAAQYLFLWVAIPSL